MADSIKYTLLNYFIAAVWLINGLLCKVLNLVPRHEQIVARVLGDDYSRILTTIIGVAEIAMAVWVISRFRSKLNTLIQIVVIVTMNIIEFFLVPDLLLWGKLNIIFALLFVGLIFYKEFIFHNYSDQPAT